MFGIYAAGNLTRDPEKSENTNAPVRICVAINDPYHKAPDDVTFLDCEIWGKARDFALGYLTKGACVAVSGSGYTHHWKRDDEDRKAIRCSVDRIEFAGPKPKTDDMPEHATSGRSAGEPPAQNVAPPMGETADDLPF